MTTEKPALHWSLNIILSSGMVNSYFWVDSVETAYSSHCIVELEQIFNLVVFIFRSSIFALMIYVILKEYLTIKQNQQDSIETPNPKLTLQCPLMNGLHQLRLWNIARGLVTFNTNPIEMVLCPIIRSIGLPIVLGISFEMPLI